MRIAVMVSPQAVVHLMGLVQGDLRPLSNELRQAALEAISRPSDLNPMLSEHEQGADTT